jgi:hypothetical protein
MRATHVHIIDHWGFSRGPKHFDISIWVKKSRGKKREIAGYVFCPFKKHNISNYYIESAVHWYFYVPVRPYAQNFLRLIVVYRFLIVLTMFVMGSA